MIILKKIKEREVDKMENKPIETLIKEAKNSNQLKSLLENVTKTAEKESNEITIPKYEKVKKK